MTDEEMAIDWIRSQGWNEETLPSDELLQMEKAYLAGLKAGKDMAEADLATVAYMQGAESQKKKSKEQLAKAKEIIEELIRFQPYIDREAMFHSIGNDWKIAISKARQFLKEVSE